MDFHIIRRLLDRRLHSSQTALIEKHCDEVQNMYRQMQAWRHDYRNHLQVMKAHLDMGEYDKLEAYILHLNRELGKIDTFLKTGNVMLDAILNSKISLAQARGIKVNAKAVIPAALPIPEYDLCVLLGNLLDNAVEGCETQEPGEERFLRVYVGVLREQLYFSVTNSHAVSVREEKGRYRSTKARGRGFGLTSIDNIIARHGGHVNRKHDEAVFATEVLLPL